MRHGPCTELHMPSVLPSLTPPVVIHSKTPHPRRLPCVAPDGATGGSGGQCDDGWAPGVDGRRPRGDRGGGRGTAGGARRRRPSVARRAQGARGAVGGRHALLGFGAVVRRPGVAARVADRRRQGRPRPREDLLGWCGHGDAARALAAGLPQGARAQERRVPARERSAGADAVDGVLRRRWGRLPRRRSGPGLGRVDPPAARRRAGVVRSSCRSATRSRWCGRRTNAPARAGG